MLRSEYESLSTMGNLDAITVPADADAALAWAIREEYALRSARYESARLGVVGTFLKLKAALVGLDAVEEQS